MVKLSRLQAQRTSASAETVTSGDLWGARNRKDEPMKGTYAALGATWMMAMAMIASAGTDNPAPVPRTSADAVDAVQVWDEDLTIATGETCAGGACEEVGSGPLCRVVKCFEDGSIGICVDGDQFVGDERSLVRGWMTAWGPAAGCVPRGPRGPGTPQGDGCFSQSPGWYARPDEQITCLRWFTFDLDCESYRNRSVNLAIASRPLVLYKCGRCP